jgi:hypothetical protein
METRNVSWFPTDNSRGAFVPCGFLEGFGCFLDPGGLHLFVLPVISILVIIIAIRLRMVIIYSAMTS